MAQSSVREKVGADDFLQANVKTDIFMRPPKVPPDFDIPDLPKFSDRYYKVYKLIKIYMASKMPVARGIIIFGMASSNVVGNSLPLMNVCTLNAASCSSCMWMMHVFYLLTNQRFTLK